MTTTPKTRTPQTPQDTPDGTLLPVPEQQDEPKFTLAFAGQLTPLESARAIERVIAEVRARTVPTERSAPKELAKLPESVAAAEAARAEDVASEERTATQYERQAAHARLRAAQLRREDPAHHYAAAAARAAQRARERVIENESAEGRFIVDVGYDDAATGYMSIRPGRLIEKGWHHKSTCAHEDPAAAAAAANPLTPDHGMILETWHGLRDWHDEEHGLSLWHGCAIQPCAGVPAAFRAEPWHHIGRED